MEVWLVLYFLGKPTNEEIKVFDWSVILREKPTKQANIEVSWYLIFYENQLKAILKYFIGIYYSL